MSYLSFGRNDSSQKHTQGNNLEMVDSRSKVHQNLLWGKSSASPRAGNILETSGSISLAVPPPVPAWTGNARRAGNIHLNLGNFKSLLTAGIARTEKRVSSVIWGPWEPLRHGLSTPYILEAWRRRRVTYTSQHPHP